MSKTMFQILHDMNVEDANNKTSLVGVCLDVIGADKCKAGAIVKMGAPESVIADMANDEKIFCLLIVDKKEYFKRKAEDEQPVRLMDMFDNTPSVHSAKC